VKLLAALGVLSLFLALLGVGASALMIHRGFSTRTEPSALEAFMATTMRRLAVTAEVKALRRPELTPDQLQEARAHWASHCANCHGVGGAGDTPMGQRLFPRAPDMRAAPTQQQSDGELYSVIKNGVRLTGMPSWGEPGDDDVETWALVAFIRTLANATESDLTDVKANLPRTPHELREELEEDEFLRGGSASPSPSSPNPKPEEHRHE